MFPMYQSEAMYADFDSCLVDGRSAQYRFAVLVAAGKINALTGSSWVASPQAKPQSYVVTPSQPWLDGYCVERGVIRQFIAMPLGLGYTAEEQLTDDAVHGGLQIAVFPMKWDEFDRRFPFRLYQTAKPTVMAQVRTRSKSASDMGLGMGGRMRQQIVEDPYGIQCWDTSKSSRCFVHLANSAVWRDLTGQKPPTTPITAKHYAQAKIPWFDYYAEGEKGIRGSAVFKKVKSIFTRGAEIGDTSLPANENITPEVVRKLRKGLGKDEVRDGDF